MDFLLTDVVTTPCSGLLTFANMLTVTPHGNTWYCVRVSKLSIVQLVVNRTDTLLLLDACVTKGPTQRVVVVASASV